MDRCDDNISRYCTLSHEETIAKIGHLLIVVESVASSSFWMRKQWRAVSLQGHIADHWYCRLWWYNQKMTFGSLFSFSEQLRSHYQNAKIFLGSHSDLNKCMGSKMYKAVDGLADLLTGYAKSVGLHQTPKIPSISKLNFISKEQGRRRVFFFQKSVSSSQQENNHLLLLVFTKFNSATSSILFLIVIFCSIFFSSHQDFLFQYKIANSYKLCLKN